MFTQFLVSHLGGPIWRLREVMPGFGFFACREINCRWFTEIESCPTPLNSSACFHLPTTDRALCSASNLTHHYVSADAGSCRHASCLNRPIPRVYVGTERKAQSAGSGSYWIEEELMVVVVKAAWWNVSGALLVSPRDRMYRAAAGSASVYFIFLRIPSESGRETVLLYFESREIL
jgi:hypothetical protein